MTKKKQTINIMIVVKITIDHLIDATLCEVRRSCFMKYLFQEETFIFLIIYFQGCLRQEKTVIIPHCNNIIIL